MQLKHFFIGMIISGMLISCGGNKSSEDGNEGSMGISESIGGLRNLNKASEAAKDWEKIQQKLVAETPLTNDEIKAFFPETLAGMKRINFAVGQGHMMGVNSGSASYSNEEGKSIELSVMDGAGETGSAMISMYAITLSMEMEEETESGYSKTTKLNGSPATVSQDSYDAWTNSEITSLVSDRYIVSLDASGLDLKELEKAFGELNLKGLR